MILGFWNWEMLELRILKLIIWELQFVNMVSLKLHLCIAYFNCCFQIASKHRDAQSLADFFAMTNSNLSIGFFPILH